MIKKFLLILVLALVFNISYCQQATFDNIGRLIAYEDKIEVGCPKQNRFTAVIFALGQSNSANHASERFQTIHPKHVFNYFNGKCYIAASPLLGATGIDGEFLTPLADNLISQGDYENVVIVSTGITGVRIDTWAKGGHLYALAQNILLEMKHKYTVTHVIWQQGESDFNFSSFIEYRNRFLSMITLFRTNKFKPIPIFYAVSTRCGEEQNWERENSVSNAQKSLHNVKNKIIMGANTDDLLFYEDRNETHCHFSKTGQIKTAQSYYEAIHKYKMRHK